MSNFQKIFFWGSATSSHQVEGGNYNNWTEWAAENAKIKSQNAKLLKWPEYILKNYPNPLQEENYISGKACDHYHRFREDFDIARSLGHNAHRFSIEWSRIEPEEGKFNEKEIEHYREVVLALLERGIEPFVTLWHFTVPIWFSKQGGWAGKDSVACFERYIKKIVASLPEVTHWIILNETNIYTTKAYWEGSWPPEEKSLIQYLLANHHLLQAHMRAHRAIKKINSQNQVGIAHNMIYFSKFPAGLKNFFWNEFFLRSLKKQYDFVGINYYHSDRKTAGRSEFMNWSIDPDGLHVLIKKIAAFGKPIYITENGLADANDTKRADFIKSHIAAIQRAMNEDIDVRGYFYWSLLDNFEWDSGFWPRFGLVEIDYKTLERKIRPSAWKYEKIIEKS